MGLFDATVKESIYDQLIKWGVSADVAGVLDGVAVLVYMVLWILLINLVFRWGVVRFVHWMVSRTKVEWDNIIFQDKVLTGLCGVLTPLIISMMLPLVVDALDITSTWMVSTLHKGVDIYFVVTLLLFVSAMFKALFALMVKRPAWQGKPLNGLLQIVQVVLAIVGVILIVAIILDKSPVGLLAGLGASAAVISFIFKDTLLGLVAGVQLSANNMLKVGDWIEMPSRGVDGTVIAVSLTTIKIRGWDNTIQTIPPYVLVSEPFTNWQAMRDTGGRRVKRSINIDVSSVKFADQAFVDRLAKDEIIASLVGSIEVVSEEGAELTNLDLYMRSVNSYIQNHPRINHDMIAMVRQLQPTERGVPIELYFFTVAVDWIPHENLQTEIISRVIALASHFDINIYQAPSGLDFKR